MKIRTDFVTNSSSSSFIIQRENITDVQLFLLVNYKELCANLNLACDNWYISYDESEVHGWTYMDNEYMIKLLSEYIGIQKYVIAWED